MKTITLNDEQNDFLIETLQELSGKFSSYRFKDTLIMADSILEILEKGYKRDE